MRAVSQFFLLACLIISVDHITGQSPYQTDAVPVDDGTGLPTEDTAGVPVDDGTGEGEDEFALDCGDEPTVFLSDQESLEIDLYYDAGFLTPDTDYIINMCEARKSYSTAVTFNFYVGVCLGTGDDGYLECTNADETDTDCTYSYEDVCASQLVPDFTEYLCCLYDSEEGPMDATTCFMLQSDNVEEFDQCVNLEHETICPDEILLANADMAWASFPDETVLPFLAFNGETDACTRDLFLDSPDDVICSMLAPGVEEACDGTVLPEDGSTLPEDDGTQLPEEDLTALPEEDTTALPEETTDDVPAY